MGKSTISMAIFNSKLLNYQRVYYNCYENHVSQLRISPIRRLFLKHWGSTRLPKVLKVILSLPENRGYYGITPSSGHYPLVNIQKAMENHHFSWVNQLFLCAMFNSYFLTQPEGKHYGKRWYTKFGVPKITRLKGAAGMIHRSTF